MFIRYNSEPSKTIAFKENNIKSSSSQHSEDSQHSTQSQNSQRSTETDTSINVAIQKITISEAIPPTTNTHNQTNADNGESVAARNADIVVTTRIENVLENNQTALESIYNDGNITFIQKVIKGQFELEHSMNLLRQEINQHFNALVKP